LLAALSNLGEKTAGMLTAGRTHSQHAVPMTFGFKVAVWSDIFLRHQERLLQCQPRLYTAMVGGAVGTFAALGDAGPRVQELVAEQLGLKPMDIPSRSIVDQFAELVCVLALLAATAQSVAEEVSRLMGTDFAEVSEALPEGDVGSSTMPQKRNAKLCLQTVIAATQARAFVPMAIEATIQAHEVDGARSAVMDRAVEGACTLTACALESLVPAIAGLQVFPGRMVDNLSRSRGLISAEAVMMALAPSLGRQVAHEVVHEAAKRVATADRPAADEFATVLLQDPRVGAKFSRDEITALLDPAAHTGLSATIARQVAARGRAATGT
jgi:3-carboxy-cis,cis-muconate cycloisomerase